MSLIFNSLLDTLPFSFSFAAGKSQCVTEAFLCGLPHCHPPHETPLPLLSLLCERGAKRRVLDGSHFLFPGCWTKTHPATWHGFEAWGGWKQEEQACKQERTE